MNYWVLDSWLVRSGHEEEFIAAWTDLIQWTMQEVPGKMGGAPLYRDFQQSQRFFCPMAWQSVEAIAAWRSSQKYQYHIRHIESLCTEWETRTLTQVAKLSPLRQEG
jgi:antibiotic biosynthesis monooxygenase (ABM) superfamily enzyme